jgi:hypothetical protein
MDTMKIPTMTLPIMAILKHLIQVALLIMTLLTRYFLQMPLLTTLYDKNVRIMSHLML